MVFRKSNIISDSFESLKANFEEIKMKNIKVNIGEIEVPDIPAMYEMSEQEYTDYVNADGLFWMDHHDNLREASTGRSLATTQEQLDILIDQLQSLRSKMKSKK